VHGTFPSNNSPKIGSDPIGWISYLEIKTGDKVLDLGCGAGGISEYISDETGAHVTGLDYAASAIDVPTDRAHVSRAAPGLPDR